MVVSYRYRPYQKSVFRAIRCSNPGVYSRIDTMTAVRDKSRAVRWCMSVPV